jgi:hypothetical protein
MAKLHHASIAAITAALAVAFSAFSCATGKIAVESGGTGGSAGKAGSGIPGGTGGSTGGSAGSMGGTGGHPDVLCTGAAECAHMTDACNVGACINAECGKLPAKDGSPCEDGKMCTVLDTCLDGVCKAGPLKNCPANGPCSVGMCDVESDTCVEVPGNNGGFCNMGDPCVILSSCLNGVCQPNQLKDCSFMASVCGDGVCDPQKGCISVPKNEGTPCNDFKFCTTNDSCKGGACSGEPNLCGVQGNDPCKTGMCDEFQQKCVVVAGNDGAGCEDGNLCTSGETCSAGICVGGTPANNGLACDDGNGCTMGTSCVNGACANPQSQINQCVDGDQCCPAGCANDKDCLWYVPGVQQNIPESQLAGWTACFTDLYDDFSTPMSTILGQCTKGKLLLACRQVGNPVLHTLAMAPRADVLFDCGSQFDCTHEANGVGWYYSDSYSWGFAPAGETVTRSSCDTTNTLNEDRLCWHSSGGLINGGWRCGANTNLNFASNWERIVYQAD